MVPGKTLTRAWCRAVGEAVERDGVDVSASAFIAAHPALARGDLLGRR
jgi:hypothetical protein